MREKLLLCPFCGGQARVRNYKDVKFLIHNANCFMVQCDGCGCGTSYEPNESDAITAWNRRAEGWISVSERLPEELEAVLVIGKNDNKYTKGYATCWICDGQWTSWYTTDITHWMRLPAPPEGVE